MSKLEQVAKEKAKILNDLMMSMTFAERREFAIRSSAILNKNKLAKQILYKLLSEEN